MATNIDTVNAVRRTIIRPCTAVYLALVAMTLVTVVVGEMQLGGLAVVSFVLGMTVLKSQLVVSWFMGLRKAPLLWRIVMSGYLIVVGAAIALAYLLGLD